MLAVLDGWQRARPDLTAAMAYFRERRTHLDYPAFRAAGWPVGSGATESGHKQVMQARMKRAGMRWARSHVNPLLALSLLEHNDRRGSEGSQILHTHRAWLDAQRRQRQHARHPVSPVPISRATPVPSAPPAATVVPSPHPSTQPLTSHPWRCYGAPLSVKKLTRTPQVWALTTTMTPATV